ncbi:MAG: hypothetical protein IJC87_03065 [Clostridia bacterium]|nr:hypothetical protein [Clostridia bacterium]
MALVNNGRKRPRIRKSYNAEVCVEETTVTAVEIEETKVVEEIVETVEETVEEIVESVEEPIEEIEEIDQNLDEVPLEMSEDEEQIALEEEGSLDGSPEEVDALASEEIEEQEPVEEPVLVEDAETVEETEEVETVEDVVVEETPVEEPAPEIVEETPVEEPTPEVVEETPTEEPAPEIPVEEPVLEQSIEEVAVTETAVAVEEVEETVETEDEEEKVEEKPKKDEFKLTAPANLDDILANICTKRARKLIYRPNEVIFSHTTTVLGTDKANDEKIKVKNILDAEIKQGVKLGYLDKFDGLKMSELKEEYENDIVYEYADQEFKRTGILLDGDKVKVYVYDWDMKACHHVGYIDDESANLVKPYILDREKYSFDINGIIVGGKYKKVIKDEKTGKITVEKGNDGNLGLEIDINIINRKD